MLSHGEEKHAPVHYTYQTLETHFRQCPIIPTVLIEKVSDAVSIAHALLKGGISQIEILVRGDTTKQQIAIDAIAAIRKHSDTQKIIVGAGTINTESKLRNAVEAGAQFLVSADNSPKVLDLWGRLYFYIPYYPGTLDRTDINKATSNGVAGIKLYPTDQLVEPDRTIKSIKDIYSCYLLLSFDRTQPSDIKYLAKDHPNVASIVASWLTPEWAIKEEKWHVISQLATLAREAITLAQQKNLAQLQEKISEIHYVAKIESVAKDQTQQEEKIAQPPEKRFEPKMEDRACQTEEVPASSYLYNKKALAMLGMFAVGAAVVGATVLRSEEFLDDTSTHLPPCSIM